LASRETLSFDTSTASTVLYSRSGHRKDAAIINGAHAILYSDDADATRAILAEVLGARSVDTGGGWLIFTLPPAVPPVDPAEEGGRAELYLMTDDVTSPPWWPPSRPRASKWPGRSAPGLGPTDGHYPPRRGQARPLPTAPPDRRTAKLSEVPLARKRGATHLQPWPLACNTPPWLVVLPPN